jgi:hypothetical protein
MSEQTALAEEDRITNEQPDMERLSGWIDKCALTMPAMKTIAGQAYASFFRDAFDKALFEIRDRHA